jgi:DNA polymerase-4
VSTLCRDCFSLFETTTTRRCPSCKGPRLLRHDEIAKLTMAHIDCDAFYATVEKRDNPTIADKPVIIGGGKRGVVSAACYVARTFGVKSAMPMPKAVVIPPNMQKYASVSRDVKQLMFETTPLVEPLSLDEAFLDLTGTERLHKRTAAQTLAHLAKRVEDELHITVSIGLSFNKFLSKVASDLDKPRGFSVIGRIEAVEFLDKRPVTLLPGVGKAFAQSLARDGIFTIGDVRRRKPKELGAHFGSSGLWLWRLSNADDTRTVEPRAEAKGISAETTFEHDVSNADQLTNILWPLCEKVSARAKAAETGGKVVQLKLKTADFKLVTRRHTLDRPTQLARRLFETASDLLKAEAKGKRYRLIGVGIADLVDADKCDGADLFDQTGARRDAAERAMDKVREKFGSSAIRKGRSL